jgi:hypothetical protein
VSNGKCLPIFQTNVVFHLQGKVVLDYIPEDLALLVCQLLEGTVVGAWRQNLYCFVALPESCLSLCCHYV